MRFNTLLNLILMMLPFSIIAQMGTVEGVVLDQESKETMIGAYVLVDGTTEGTTTDIDGFFVLRLAPGTYSLTITSIGYANINIKDIIVEAGKKTEVNASLTTESVSLNEVIVTDVRKTNTDVAVLMEVKKAKQVVSAISSQQIQRSQDNNAAQVMQRIPGVTIIENRFVMVRGLAERYNNVMINNVVAPSTEVDKRTFSFDLISSGALDRMLIYKSGSADLPGDFSGAVIKVFTVEDVEDNYFKINLGLGYRQNTSLKDFYQSNGSKTDILGFDNGFRSLPSTFPNTSDLQGSNRNAQIRRDGAVSLPNNFVANKVMATPDYSVGLSFGRNFDFGGGKKLTTINNVNLSTSYSYYNRDFYRYFEWEDRSQPILRRFEYLDNTYEKENKVSILSNWSLQLNNKTRIRFKNLFNQIGENETVIRMGTDYIQRVGEELRNYLLGYRSRTIYTGQLEGDHNVNDKLDINWVFGGSYLNENEPDLRRFRTFRRSDAGDINYTVQLPPSSNLFETGRYYGKLFEFSGNNGLNITYKPSGNDKVGPTIKGGYYADYRARDFSSRYISYLYPGFFNPTVGQELIQLPLDKVFAPENIRTVDGLVIEEGTRPIDSYDASNLLLAGYGQAEIPLGKVNLNLGIRVEHNTQILNSRNDFEEVTVNLPKLSVLPFANAGYNVTDKSIIRLGYGRTVNRPEFRELAPFLFYDYNLEAARVGNPNLTNASIDNLDLRYEYYPRNGELISFAAFYKYFNDPIENKTIITTEQPQFTFINAENAKNYGAELELRKSLRGVTNSSFIDNFSLNLNGSLIFSSVDLGDIPLAQARTRPLQGQSPYIVNAAIYYSGPGRTNVNLIYNVFGARIFSVGDVLFPTIYERPRNSLDINFSKTIKDKITYKLGVTDLLNARYRFYQDSDRDEKIDQNDDVIFSFRRGTLLTFNISYKL
jgi:hypothetical protein